MIIADSTIVLPPALAGVPMEVVADRAQRMGRIGVLADAYVALPGSLASASSLFGAWTAGRRAGQAVPGGDAQPAPGL